MAANRGSRKTLLAVGLAALLGCHGTYAKKRDAIAASSETAIEGMGSFVTTVADNLKSLSGTDAAFSALQRLGNGLQSATTSTDSASNSALIGILSELASLLEASGNVSTSGGAPTGTETLAQMIWSYPRVAGLLGAGNPGVVEIGQIAQALADAINNMSGQDRADLASSIRSFIQSIQGG